jgi:carbonic anhydrase
MLEFTHSEPAVQHAHIHWSYEGPGGPENWAGLDPKNRLCGTGQRQSPIDIKDGIKVDLEPIKFNYRPSTFRLVDNGHTLQVEVGDGSFTLTGKTYELVQFHFHRRPRKNRRPPLRHGRPPGAPGRRRATGRRRGAARTGPKIPSSRRCGTTFRREERPVEPPSALIDLGTLVPAPRAITPTWAR